MELASVWIRHGKEPIEVIWKALGYSCPAKFAADYLAERRIAVGTECRRLDWRQLSKLALRQKLRPFWLLDEAEARHNLTEGCPHRNPKAAHPQSGDSPSQGSEIPDLTSFWDLKSTGVLELIALNASPAPTHPPHQRRFPS